MSLQQTMNHSFDLYGRRNRLFLPGIVNRILFLNLAIGDLQDAIRKGYSKAALGAALARVVSRTFCIAEYFRDLPLVASMATKYPAGRCSYCGTSPCSCTEKRPAPTLAYKPDPLQLAWGLEDWQTHLDRLYGSGNRKKGIENVVNRLFKETCELLSLAMEVATSTSFRSQDEIEKDFSLELADALAWTIAVANVLEIDLLSAFLHRYGDGCRKCGKNPCACANFAMTSMRWAVS